jgi:hypothetical protein
MFRVAMRTFHDRSPAAATIKDVRGYIVASGANLARSFRHAHDGQKACLVPFSCGRENRRRPSSG